MNDPQNPEPSLTDVVLGLVCGTVCERPTNDGKCPDCGQYGVVVDGWVMDHIRAPRASPATRVGTRTVTDDDDPWRRGAEWLAEWHKGPGGDVSTLRGYIAGYRQAIADTGKCGAHNAETPASRYAACIRPYGHTGMHDDGWTPWGSPQATQDDNHRDSAAERQRVRGTGDQT